ncbi:phosphonate C-P lyase system protein PhnG [Pseudogracilibacillus auburnensis]|uniref:Alpha-D-ribose 1-methylphosphonate 5-triphosphate synthase subunit PhnG n=1 Tax=Pseudogracilibacillus auburnensis TaxID=1494959 RepID=A0A2V3WDK1_9BACI|nr:alpha-D-ribose 1-methylphosphonate 5-triphosphate synthase subunit PhnG [Pseudogracilibacillus auburnensis]
MLRRKERTEILIQYDSCLAAQFAAEITDRYDCFEIIAPHYGLTMMKMRESAQNSLFYIGEVLVTECKIEIESHIGIGIVVGMKNELAKHLAIIDAAYEANLPETVNWKEPLHIAQEKINETKVKKQALFLDTKVNFDTMEV